MARLALSEGRYLDAGDGLRLHFQECGSGPAVIFLHGSGPGASGQSNFESNMLEFARAGFRAIALDLFGYGQSSKPADRRYELAFQVVALKSLVTQLGLRKVNLVGNSMGGAVALRFAMENAERMNKLILLAPGGLGKKLRYLRMPGIRAMMWTMLGPGGPSWTKLKKVFDRQVYDPSKIPDALISERLAVAKTQPRQVYSTLKVDNLLPRLGEIACPTLCFWGTDDQFCPVETAALLADGIRDCKVMLVGRCGHWVQMEHPELFNGESLRFLADEVQALPAATELVS
ncbi:alpha/beta hydrolase [Crenobacter sp. SG2303]|uniref:Alpha/beta hydrolase n=1 Tax=Crenobacter oryzisoli TaxID=3056844 RepID=A0ABT7XSA8_9NEIS|nr:alpha/beta hydrolase [Crenobacter sp. SG2303]MDN0076598.1 alpha/beta hydrolase [Crenobacter sp. SG2303]